jgi:hypothetical protein
VTSTVSVLVPGDGDVVKVATSSSLSPGSSVKVQVRPEPEPGQSSEPTQLAKVQPDAGLAVSVMLAELELLVAK